MFLGRRHNGQAQIVATGFFLSIKDDRLSTPDRQMGFIYLVTAGHVIEHTKSTDYSDDGIVYLYLNAKIGMRFKLVRTEIKDWVFHPTDSAVDIAALPWSIDPTSDHSAIPFEQPPGLEPNPKTWRVEVGTDVIIAGLFLRHAGRQRNIPIIRTGTIAAMPEEPVNIVASDGGERNIKAYLVETHSLGGLSGSPVFANPMTIHGRGEGNLPGLQANHIWIGVISAHWDFDLDGTQQEKINSGIAIVSPKESVAEVLQHPRLIEMREKEMKRHAKRIAPTMDDVGESLTQKTHAPKTKDRIDIPIPTRGQFEHDLGKATRRKTK